MKTVAVLDVSNKAAPLVSPPMLTSMMPVIWARGNTGKAAGALSCPLQPNSIILRLVWRSKCLQHPSVLPVSGIIWSLPSVPQDMAVLVTECEELGVLTS
eukprot:scaffold27645_cov20-Tisochrysis_lutea.AAC.2